MSTHLYRLLRKMFVFTYLYLFSHFGILKSIKYNKYRYIPKLPSFTASFTPAYFTHANATAYLNGECEEQEIELASKNVGVDAISRMGCRRNSGSGRCGKRCGSRTTVRLSGHQKSVSERESTRSTVRSRNLQDNATNCPAA